MILRRKEKDFRVFQKTYNIPATLDIYSSLEAHSIMKSSGLGQKLLSIDAFSIKKICIEIFM